MKKATSVAVFILFIIVAMSLAAQNPPVPAQSQPPAAPAPGANPLADYTRQIKYDGLTLSVVLVNARTADILFQAPIKYSMRARANQQTVLYIQGTPQKEIEFTNTFTIVQNGETLSGTSTNLKNFVTGKAPTGQRIDGLIEFPKKVDINKPFTVKNGKGEVEFVLTPEAIKALQPAGQ